MSGTSSEIRHKGLSLLVQTQDKGLQAQYVESLVYHSGKLVFSRKTFYTQFLNDADLKRKVARLLIEQHHKIMSDISAGRLDHHLFKSRS